MSLAFKRPKCTANGFLILWVNSGFIPPGGRPDVKSAYRPKCMGVLWVSHGDVAGQAIGVIFAREHTQGKRHLLKEPLPLGGKCGMLGDAGKTFPLRQKLKRCLPRLLNLISLRGRCHDWCRDWG